MSKSRIYGSVWSKEYIDAEPLAIVPKHLLPWLIKDRKNAIEGSMEWNSKEKKLMHDGSGLEKAEQSLRAATHALADNPSDPVVREFLEFQKGAAEGKVAFYSGKVYLLDKLIAETQRRVE